MRLTVFGPAFPFRGGIASTTTALVLALKDRGHDVQFLTPRRQYPRVLFPGTDDRDPEACPQVAGAEALFAPLEPWTWQGARRRALEFGADAWILPYWTWAWAPMWLAMLRKDSAGPPTVAVVHNVYDHDAGPIKRWVGRRVLARCRAFLTHAEILKSELETAFPKAPVSVYPLPAVMSREMKPEREAVRASMGLASDQRLAVFLGLIRPYKGVDCLLEAFALLPEASPWRLVVAGEPWGKLGDDLKEQVRTLNLGDRVQLEMGWVPEAEVDRLLSAADLLVLPYRTGTQSAVAPMALSRGVPVLSTDVGGLGEVVEEGVSGVLVEPNSSRALADALLKLEGESLEQLAAGALTHSGRWTWSGYAEAIENLVEEL